jgi:hypothetical protein
MPGEIKNIEPAAQEGIFISYRRDGSSTFSSILYYELCKFFSPEFIFKDIYSLKPGSNFKMEIEAGIERSFLMLVLIDKSWVHLKNENGEERIFLENDFVHHEIKMAIDNNLEIIPVLFENGKMPEEKELPGSLQPLCSKQAFIIRVDSVMQDIASLVEYIRSKKRFYFDEQSITGAYERLLKDPIGTVKKSWKQNVTTFKKDFNYLRKFIGKYKK